MMYDNSKEPFTGYVECWQVSLVNSEVRLSSFFEIRIFRKLLHCCRRGSSVVRLYGIEEVLLIDYWWEY